MKISMLKDVFSYYCNKCSLDSSTFGAAFAFVLLAVVVLMPESAAAANASTDFDGIVCNIITLLQGNAARGIAAIAIIFLGFSLFLGKISWGVALALGLGIAAVFGAQSIVEAVTTGTGASGTTCP